MIVAPAIFAALCCGGGDAEDDGPDEDAERFACVFESSLIDSCNNPEGSPWVEGCANVLTDEDCTLATAEMVEEVGDCTFTTTYRNAMTTPGMACPDAGTTGPSEIEPGAAGEPCSSLGDCESSLCVPRFYCTVSCTVDEECADDFPSGCCVGEGSLGYCIAEEDCAQLCPENSTPSGLPTLCVCDDGFEYDPMTGECAPV